MKAGFLFAGIGGFELAAQWAGIEPVWSNEIDPFCCKVLRKNFTHEIIEADIRDCGKGRKHELRPVDIICGGFPCQPFSVAGKREAEKDDRHLWPEMLRIIRELRPRLVVAENVPGLITISGGLVFEQVCTDLESEGYEVQPFIIPAVAVNAPHRRDRVWIIAYADDYGPYGAENRQSMGKGDDKNTAGQVEAVKPSRRAISNPGIIANASYRNDWQPFREPENRQTPEFGNDIEQGATANANRKHGDNSGFRAGKVSQFKKARIWENNASNTGGTRCEEHDATGFAAKPGHGAGIPSTGWQDFPTQSPVCNGNDGIPSGLVRGYRSKAIQAGGNAIVPQVAFEIFKAIKEITNS